MSDDLQVSITDVDGAVEHVTVEHESWFLITHGYHVSSDVRYANGTVVLTLKPGDDS